MEESDTEAGVVGGKAEERLEEAMRAALVDFLERFFLWCALFRPVAGSRGMRSEKQLTRIGRVRVARRYVAGDRSRPGFLGRAGRCTEACERILAEEGCDRSSFRRAETVARARGIDVSASKIREVTLRRGREEYERPAPPKVDLAPSGACGGRRRRTAATMVVLTDGTCVPCAGGDLAGVKGRDGGEATGRNVDVGLVAVYDSVRREDNRPVIPPSSRRYVVGANADEVWGKIRAAALAAGYGKAVRFQVIGDGAAWIENGASVNFPGQRFTLDCYHALEYVGRVCAFLAGDAGEARSALAKAKARLLAHDFDRAERYLRCRYRKHFTDEGLKLWTDEASKAWKYLDARRGFMNYGWLRRHGYLIGSGHVESACKVVVGQRCKGPGMHWRYRNALYVTALRARMRSAKSA